jgi:hypothetical protein
MAKRIKEELEWLTLNVATFHEELQRLDAELRQCFALTNEVKARYEAVLTRTIKANVSGYPAVAQQTLKYDATAKAFPVGTTLKFGYRGGVAVATGTASKARAGGVTI